MSEITLSASQIAFLYQLETKYRAFVGGFGSGKTAVGCLDLSLFAAKYPKVTQGYFAPTYGAIKDIFYPTMDEMSSMVGFQTKIRLGDSELDVYRGRKYYGTIKCRSMDDPNKIIGFKIARALIDEIDILPTDKAANAWRKIIARLRLKIDGVENGVGVTTTPEGFKFVYERFKSNPTKSYSMVQASTYENERFLPADYIPSLLESYPSQLIEAYIEGQFVNLNSGTVYHKYDRVINNSFESIQPNEPLFIGMDFNVTKMAATTYVKRPAIGGLMVWHAVDEIYDAYDTPAMIEIIDERYAGHPIHIYPDASGKNRKSNGASSSDIGLLEKYRVHAKDSNPLVKDRVIASNNAFEKCWVMVNVLRCPQTANCLEQQIYGKNGEPDKTSGKDHQNDATTYPIVFEMPVVKPLSNPSIHIRT